MTYAFFCLLEYEEQWFVVRLLLCRLRVFSYDTCAVEISSFFLYGISDFMSANVYCFLFINEDGPHIKLMRYHLNQLVP